MSNIQELFSLFQSNFDVTIFNARRCTYFGPSTPLTCPMTRIRYSHLALNHFSMHGELFYFGGIIKYALIQFANVQMGSSSHLL